MKANRGGRKFKQITVMNPKCNRGRYYAKDDANSSPISRNIVVRRHTGIDTNQSLY